MNIQSHLVLDRFSSFTMVQTVAVSLCSLLTLSSETLNVWTHLVGFFLFLGLYIYTMYVVAPLGWVHALVLSGFLLSVMACMLCSAAFHLFLCHSEASYYRLLRADLTGVCLQIYGSFVPGLYYGFACEPVWRIVYLVLVTVLVLVGLIAPCFPRFHHKSFTIGRLAVYAAIAGFGTWSLRLPLLCLLYTFASCPLISLLLQHLFSVLTCHRRCAADPLGCGARGTGP